MNAKNPEKTKEIFNQLVEENSKLKNLLNIDKYQLEVLNEDIKKLEKELHEENNAKVQIYDKYRILQINYEKLENVFFCFFIFTKN